MGKVKVSEKNVPYGARERMPFWYSLAWTSRGISAALNVILVGYITYYCTDMLGLSAGLIGAILLGSKIIDAVTDLLAGYFIDKTHTRWGKARPYEFFIVLQWLFTVLMFSVPDGSKALQYGWVFVMFVLINAVCATALGAADSVYMARTFTTVNNRIKAMSVNGTVVMICCIVFNIMIPQFISNVGTTKAGWLSLSATMAAPLAIIGLLRFFLCKEIATDSENVNTDSLANKDEKLNLSSMLKVLAKNKYVFIVVGLMLITNIINGMASATTYYFKYMMGDIGLMSLASMTSLITPLVLVFFPVLSRKFGTTKILQVGAVIGIAGMIIRTIGGASMPTIIIGGAFSGLAIMPISMMINTYLIDCMDYGEWKTGIRVEGLVASVVNFSAKVGSGIASGLVGFVMGMAGYDGSLTEQSATANAAIVGLYNWLPLVMFIFMLVLALMYKMDKFRPQMMEDLKKKHEGI